MRRIAAITVFTGVFAAAIWAMVAVKEFVTADVGYMPKPVRHDADVELALRFLDACEPRPDERVIVECYRGLAVCNRWERDDTKRGRMNRVERVVFGTALEYCGRQ